MATGAQGNTMVNCYQVCEDHGAVLFVPLGLKHALASDAERDLEALRSAHPKAYIAELKVRPIAKH